MCVSFEYIDAFSDINEDCIVSYHLLDETLTSYMNCFWTKHSFLF